MFMVLLTLTTPVNVGKVKFFYVCWTLQFLQKWSKLSWDYTCECKEGKKDDALLNVAYLKQANKAHVELLVLHYNIFNIYLPALLYLPSTTPVYASVSNCSA